LKVTKRSARPLTAVSRTISSRGSDRRGRHKNLIWTGSAILTSELITSSSCVTVRPGTFLCSSRLNTDSYWRTRGTLNSSVIFLVNARSTNCHEAPERLRVAATSTSVSSTRRKLYDIAYDITSQERFYYFEDPIRRCRFTGFRQLNSSRALTAGSLRKSARRPPWRVIISLLRPFPLRSLSVRSKELERSFGRTLMLPWQPASSPQPF